MNSESQKGVKEPREASGSQKFSIKLNPSVKSAGAGMISYCSETHPGLIKCCSHCKVYKGAWKQKEITLLGFSTHLVRFILWIT